MCILKLNNVSKTFNNFYLDNINFELPKGYIIGYIGPNGSGKTTTIKLITDQYLPDSGTIYINGKKLSDSEKDYRNSIGYIADDFYFPDFFKIHTIKKILKDFYPTFDPLSFDEYISLWKLPCNHNVGTFSKGMKVRLMFACVLSRKPEILILDEATNGLDPVVRTEILQILKDYIKDGEHSVLFSTHILSELDNIADYIYMILDGKCTLMGTNDELLDNFILITGSIQHQDFFKKKCVSFIQKDNYLEGLVRSDNIDFLPNNLSFKRPTLEQILLYHSKEDTYCE